MKKFKKEDLLELMSLYQAKEYHANADRNYDREACAHADRQFLLKCEEMDISISQGRKIGWGVISNFDEIKKSEAGTVFEFEVVQ
jgi:hypothetical protein